MCGSPGPPPSLVSPGFYWTLGQEESLLNTVEAEVHHAASLSLLWGEVGPADLHGLKLPCGLTGRRSDRGRAEGRLFGRRSERLSHHLAWMLLSTWETSSSLT